jgi:hypothetical protein
LRVNVADAEHDRRARRREVRAFHARQRAFAQRGERGAFSGDELVISMEIWNSWLWVKQRQLARQIFLAAWKWLVQF